MLIRELKPADLDRVMDIWLTGNLDAHGFLPREYWLSQRAVVRAALQRTSVYCAVDTNGKVQGFIGLTGNYVNGLFVDRRHRRQGIGRQLIDFAKHRTDQLELDAYRQNENAVRFYRQQGFLPVHQSTDEIRMRWKKK